MQLWNIPFELPPRHPIFNAVRYAFSDPSIKIVLIFILDMLFQVPHRDLFVMQYNISTGRSLKLTMSSARGLPVLVYIRLRSLIR